MAVKPRLSFAQIWNMSFGFMGIQFGFALQNANTSRIFETLGAKVEDIPILWIAAPVTGLIVQPIIGHLSDKTWTSLGRRRPYFLIGAILASLALFVMPNSPVLWVAAGMLWIMDASINVSMEPFRAFVGDMLPDAQRTTGFAMQSFFIGVGAVVASALPYVMGNWFGISNTAAEGVVPDSVKWSFYAGGVIFFLCVLWTVLSTKEYSPEELKSFESDKQGDAGFVGEELALKELQQNQTSANAVVWLLAGLLLTAANFYFDVDKELYILTSGLMVYGALQMLAKSMADRGSTSGFVLVVHDLNTMPKTMKQLALVQFFSWLGLFAMWIYTTQAVTSHIYGTSDTTSALYNEGADWVGVLFAVYNGFAAVFAFLLPVIAQKTSRKITHLIALSVGGVGLASFYIISDPTMLVFPMVGVGLAWASILSMPYAILTGALPANRMGTYMGIFNFFIVIPQILAATILGFFVSQLFGGQTIYVLVLGGVSLVLGGFLTLWVDDVTAETG